jgi:hypothetical protein
MSKKVLGCAHSRVNNAYLHQLFPRINLRNKNLLTKARVFAKTKYA